MNGRRRYEDVLGVAGEGGKGWFSAIPCEKEERTSV